MGVIFLVGCSNEEGELVAEAKSEFRILYEYEEDKIRPVVEGDLSEEELARKYLLSRLELEEDDPVYKERGVMEGQGIFLESAIYDGGTVPNVSPISKDTLERIQGSREDRSLARKQEEFRELSESRELVLERQYDVDNTGLREVEDEIRRRVKEYEQDTGILDEGQDAADFDIEGED